MIWESRGGVVVMGPAGEAEVVTSHARGATWAKWRDVEPGTYECCVHITEEADGFCIHMASLPGVVSQGDTKEEAIANIKEAFQGVVESYREDDEEIPWVQSPEPPDNQKTKVLWIVVHV